VTYIVKWVNRKWGICCKHGVCFFRAWKDATEIGISWIFNFLQVSVEKPLRWRGNSSNLYVQNFLGNLMAKEFLTICICLRKLWSRIKCVVFSETRSACDSFVVIQYSVDYCTVAVDCVRCSSCLWYVKCIQHQCRINLLLSWHRCRVCISDSVVWFVVYMSLSRGYHVQTVCKFLPISVLMLLQTVQYMEVWFQLCCHWHMRVHFLSAVKVVILYILYFNNYLVLVTFLLACCGFVVYLDYWN